MKATIVAAARPGYLQIDMNGQNYLVSDPENPVATCVLAHGAGAPMDDPALDHIAIGVSDAGIRVIRFEFPYMRARRESGRRGGPDAPNVLRQTWTDVIADVGGAERMFIGGRSMGGRIASMVVDEAGVAGLICLGYPFHPAGKPDRLRTAHLRNLRTPTLIVQGTRDQLGLPEEIDSYELSDSISLVYLDDGDHSFKPRKTSGLTQEQHLDTAVSEIVRFVQSLLHAR